MNAHAPIGFFDSGVGGLSIWREVHALLPQESTIYLADSLYAPYGERSAEEIVALSRKNTEMLLRLGCKMIVVACNTATTNAIQTLRSQYDVPFIGIEPATKPAAINTQTGKIGILATKGTLASELFLQTSKAFRGHVQIIETVGTGLVSIIESGNLDDAKPLLRAYLDPMVAAGVDNIVLGCTHYPFLTPLMRTMLPANVRLVDSGEAVARQVSKVLDQNQLNLQHSTTGPVTPSHRFVTNSNREVLQYFLSLVGMSSTEAEFMTF